MTTGNSISNDIKENKRLAKNTIMLFFRMILTMCIGLFTSRVVLATLGVSDYGLFNVVGGVVTMFSFVASTLAGGTSRFLNIAQGTGRFSDIRETFLTSFTLHLLLSLLFFVVVLAIGYYFVNYELNIPHGRENAANLVLFFCLLSISFDILKVPFDATIIAHEYMGFYAVLSILEASLKLLIVYVLIQFPNFDNLILYSILYAASGLIILVIYIVYCKNKFKECKYLKLYFDFRRIKEIGAYVSWALIGNMTYMLSSQGVNILFNIFGNTIINAARGISVQIGGVLTRFVSNIAVATNPQIIKRYSTSEYDSMFTLAKNVSKYTGILMFFFSIPIVIEMDFLLSVWLVEVPMHTPWFAMIMVLQAFFAAISMSSHTIVVATGKIKGMQIWTGIIQVVYVIASYVSLKLGCTIDIVMSLYIFPALMIFVVYLFYIQKYTGLKVVTYFKDVFFILFVVFTLSFTPSYLIHIIEFESEVVRFVLVVTSSTAMLLLSSYLFAINKDTKVLVVERISRIFVRRNYMR